MLNFLSHLLGKKSGNLAKAESEKKKTPSVSQQAKQQALVQAEQLPEDDTQIISFIMQCRFADARYRAAQKLTSEKAMEQIRTAMQKTDRRVYRLLQTRLQNKEQNDALNRQIYSLLAYATELTQNPALTPNLVAELDRKWAELVSPVKSLPKDIEHCFKQCQHKLATRLAAQLDLQREIRSCLDEISTMQNNLTRGPSDSQQLTDIFKERLNVWLSSPEKASLPSQLLEEFESRLKQFETLAQWHKLQHDAYRIRCEWLAKCECAEINSLNEQTIKEQWRAFTQVDEPSLRETLETRFERLMMRFIVDVPTLADNKNEIDLTGEQLEEYVTKHFEALSSAVAAGAVQDALAHDDALRRVSDELLNKYEQIAKHLPNIRGELRRLNDWAKWSGELSREKLVRFVQNLQPDSMSINELAETIMQAREQWKALNEVSGTASSEQWVSFDTACNKAYAPVLEHAKQQAEQRQMHIEQAQALIERIKKFSGDFKILYERGKEDAQSFEWKLVISFYRMATQTWRQLGIVGRKEKKRLDDEFNEAIGYVREKLYAQTEQEIQRREKIIEQVREIDPEQRDAGKMLRAIQQQWQIVARNFPLDNREDKKLWTRFREVCEHLHEKRMEKTHALEKERAEHLHDKQLLCQTLEELSSLENASDIQQRLDQALVQWKKLGRVPRDKETEIQKRFDLACSSCRKQIAAIQTCVKHAAMLSFSQKLALCCETEEKVVANSQAMENAEITPHIDDALYEEKWSALPVLPEKIETLLQHRFYTALKAMASCNRAYARRLVNNEQTLQEELLRYEVVYDRHLEDDLSEKRKQMKFALLQETLSGGQEKSHEEVIRSLLSLPAITNENDQKRLNNLICFLSKNI